MKIVVISETHEGERRVALVPDIAAKLAAPGFEVAVEAGAGEQAGFTDDDYREIGVAIETDRQALLSTADVVLSVQPPRLEDVAWLQAGAASISLLQPTTQGGYRRGTRRAWRYFVLAGTAAPNQPGLEHGRVVLAVVARWL